MAAKKKVVKKVTKPKAVKTKKSLKTPKEVFQKKKWILFGIIAAVVVCAFAIVNRAVNP